MGIVNVRKGLGDSVTTYSFNGPLRGNIDLDWEYTEIYLGSKKLDPCYIVKDDDVILIQELPGAGLSAAAVITLVGIGLTAVAGLTTGIIAAVKADEAEKEYKKALDKLKNKTNKNEQKTIPWLSGGKNEKADGKQLPIILGRHLFTPYYLSDPYLEVSGVDGEDLFWYGAFVCGQRDLCIEKIRNGTTNLVAFDDTIPQRNTFPFNVPPDYRPDDPKYKPPPFYDPQNKVEIIQEGYFSDPVFNQKWVDSLDSSVEIGRKQSETQKTHSDGITIIDEGPEIIIRESAKFPMRLEIELFVDGLYGWNSKKNEETSASVSVSVEWSASGNEGTWKPIPINWRILPDLSIPASTTINSLIKQLESRFDTEIPALAHLSFPLQPGSTINNQSIDRLSAMKKFTTNSGSTISPGLNINPSVVFYYGDTLVYEISGADNTQIGRSIFLNGGGFADKLTRTTSKQMRFIAAVDLPASVYSEAGNPVYIRAIRNTRMHTGGYRDRVYLSAIRTKLYSPEKSSSSELVEAKNLNERLAGNGEIPGKVCRMGIKLKVNQNTEEALDRFNIVASMAARTWDGASWSTEKTKTSNPAAVALEVLTGLVHDLSAYKDEEIDRDDSFGKLYEFCESREVNTGGGPVPLKLESNGVITTATKKLDILKSVLAACEAGLYVNEFGKIIVYHDDIQENPIALLNPQRIVSMGESRNLDRRADGYKVEFIDRDADWNLDTREILRPGVVPDPGKNTFTTVKFDLSTSYNQAMWHARRLMAKEIHRPGEVKVSVGKEGRLYRPGSLIKVQHEGFKIGIGSGEIIEVLRDGDFITGFRLMERFDIASDRDYFIEYYIVDGNRNRVIDSESGRILKLRSVGEYTNVLTLSAPIPADDFYTPAMGNILSVLYGAGLEGNVYEAKRYLVSGLSETSQGYDLTLVQYSGYIYGTTTIDKIPAYSTSILSAPSRVYNDTGDRQMMMENRIPDAQAIDHIAAGTAGREIPKKTPRYRGAANTADLENTGIISTNQGSDLIMNIGDWVMLIGQSRLYEWRGKPEESGEGWVLLPIEENRWRYLDSINDLTEGAVEGIFSNAFINTLVTKTAIIERLFSELIEMSGDGVIQSEGFTGIDGTTPGFWLKAFDQAIGGGLLEVNKGKFSGGDFYNINIKNRFTETQIINQGSLIFDKVGYYSGSITLNSGWYFLDIAGGGGGNGANSSNQFGKFGLGGSGGVIKIIINIIYDNTACYIYIGERGKNASSAIGAEAGRGHNVELFNLGPNGPRGGAGGDSSYTVYYGGDGGKGSSFNGNNATNGKKGSSGLVNQPYDGGGGGGGGNTILYIPTLGIIYACSGGGGGGGESGGGISPVDVDRADAGENGENGTNSINNSLGNLVSQEGYVKIYKAP